MEQGQVLRPTQPPLATWAGQSTKLDRIADDEVESIP